MLRKTKKKIQTLFVSIVDNRKVQQVTPNV